ncbi:hypothetical protein [Entomospira culicis]|uniref:Uncharacterized protein n=1 Tax=Entomospira culicis TaxID=2719989 RepID=A0A968GEI4_9SPIO|nr:hypothetical protein [Entomospira culicis]NIZ18587.1 hypothetical protein [Entomospira culicis]NIZ68802.1 hypothetical protein [Entomospira culicis]WDI37397.1 hypothetical protein PVA46_01010 [Entomospira culicis]WDI39026.1 hypothetical protein PVA47_01020 [Entomospira culicis]
MKKLVWLVAIVLTATMLYAQQITSIKRIDLLADGVLFNKKEKLVFGVKEDEVVALLGAYEKKGRGDYPSTILDFLYYKKSSGLEVILGNDTFSNITVRGEAATYPLYLEGKKLFIGQKSSAAKKLLAEYKILKVWEFNKSYNKEKHQRVTYAIGDNYLDVDYSYDTDRIIEITYGNFYFH